MIRMLHEGLWRGPEPLTDSDWHQLQDLGIKVCLDLENGELFDGDLNLQVLEANEYGIKTINYPLGQLTPPTKQELNDCVSLMRTYLPMYVHCKAGVDRTGIVCARYRMVAQGWSKDQAVDEMKRLGMHWWYFWWSWFL